MICIYRKVHFILNCSNYTTVLIFKAQLSNVKTSGIIVVFFKYEQVNLDEKYILHFAKMKSKKIETD